MLLSLRGRMTRRAYILINIFLFMLPASFGKAFEKEIERDYELLPDPLQMIVLILFVLVILWLVWIIGVRMPVRRLHDINLSGAYWFALVLLNMVPLVGAVAVFAWLGFWPGTKGRNIYGADPRGPGDRDVAQVFDGPPIIAAPRPAE